ncbi:MAG: hypothetical protein AABZ41_03350, partial [Bacteroidota bacterium]
MKTWPTIEYTRDQVAAAGKVVKEGEPDWENFEGVDDEERVFAYASAMDDHNKALKVVNNWRAIHGFPLNTFQMRLRSCARK